MLFIDLKKTYDGVPSKILKWALIKKGLLYMNIIQDI